jgi:hypothetical protein
VGHPAIMMSFAGDLSTCIECNSWILLRYTGTHKGEFMGLAPMGKQATALVVDMYHIKDGKIVWGKRVPTPDLAFFMQLGACGIHRKGTETLPKKHQIAHMHRK